MYLFNPEMFVFCKTLHMLCGGIRLKCSVRIKEVRELMQHDLRSLIESSVVLTLRKKYTNVNISVYCFIKKTDRKDYIFTVNSF